MANYLASQIIAGALEYCAVTAKYSTLKTGIDTALTTKGHPEMIKTDCPVA
jgi:hypothetical protein